MTRATTKRTGSLAIGVAFAAIAVAAIHYAAPAMAQSEQHIAVLVNDQPISSYDVQQRVRLITVTTGQKNTDRVRNRAIDELIDEALMLQEAKRLNIEVPPETVQQELQNIAKLSKMSTQQLTRALSSAGINVNAFSRRIEAQIAWSMVIRNRFSQTIKVRPDDIDSALQRQEGPTISSRYEFKLQGILFIVPEGAAEATVSAKRNMAQRFQRGFTSCGDTKAQLAGLPDILIRDIGTRTSDVMSSEDQKLFGKLNANEATPPRRSDGGFEVVAICSKTEIQDEQLARRAAELKLLNQEFELRARRHLHDLKQDAVIERR